jgi:hypothetical protein
VGLGVVVALVDVLLEVGDDRAAHGAGGGPAGLPALEWAEVALLARVGFGSPAVAAAPARVSPATAVPAARAALPAAVSTAALSAAAPAASLRRAAPIVPLSPRHRTSLGRAPADSLHSWSIGSQLRVAADSRTGVVGHRPG